MSGEPIVARIAPGVAPEHPRFGKPPGPRRADPLGRSGGVPPDANVDVVARGYALVRDVSKASEMLLEGDRLAPSEIRCRPLAREVLVSLIAGVPVGYDQGTAEIEYSAAEPGSSQAINFGVAPGCVNTEDGSNSTAIPPVREREVAEAFAGSDGARNVFSICQDDYSPALEQIAAAVRRALPPACAGACIEDSDPETKVLEPVCSVTASFADGGSEQVPACVVDGEGWAVPAGAQVCFAMLVDPDGRTPFKGDDMTPVVDAGGAMVPACSTDRENVEFKLVRTGPRRAGVSYEAACVAADDNTRCAAD